MLGSINNVESDSDKLISRSQEKMYRDTLKLDQHFVENTRYEFVQYK